MEQVRTRVEVRAREASAERGPEPPAAAKPKRGRGASQPEREFAAVALPPSESFSFHGNSIYWSSRGRGVGKLLRASRRLLAPLVKFVFNIDPMVDALATQARRNAQQAAFDDDVARRLAAREGQDALNRRVVERLAVQMERLAVDMESHRTLVVSVVERLDALEGARAGEQAVKPQGDRQTDERPDDDAPASPPAAAPPTPNR